MATFNKDKLTCMSQGIAGPRVWAYTDTGLLIADVNEVDGFFSTGYDCGMRRGDRIFITEGDTGTWSATDVTGRRQYTGTIVRAQDTGSTQIMVGLCVLVGDTS
jgi:hypothetical protein